MEIISLILTIGIYGLTLIMVISFVLLIRRNINNKKIVDCIMIFDDESLFFSKINSYLETAKNQEFIEKAKILKLWGNVFYKRDDEVIPLLESINLIPIVVGNGFNKKNKLQLNEDCLYYLCLASCNTLYGRKNFELLNKFREKLNEYDVLLEKNLAYAISKESFRLYDNEGDKGEGFFLKVIEGEYGGYNYSKQLIGIYKKICSSFLAKIYSDKNDTESFEKVKEDVIYFYETIMGKRYLSELNVNEQWLQTSEEVKEVEQE